MIAAETTTLPVTSIMSAEQKRNRLAEFFEDEYSRMVNFVRGRASDIADQDAEDIVGEIVFNMVDRADVAAPIENLISYAYQALRNRVVDFFRVKKPAASLDEPLDDSGEMTLIDTIGDTRYPADESYAKSRITAQLFNAMQGLNDEERAVVIATEVEGASFVELSEEWKIPLNTLLSRKSRAMKKIQKQYRESIKPENRGGGV